MCHCFWQRSSLRKPGRRSALLWEPLSASLLDTIPKPMAKWSGLIRRWRLRSTASPLPTHPPGAPSCPGWNTHTLPLQGSPSQGRIQETVSLPYCSFWDIDFETPSSIHLLSVLNSLLPFVFIPPPMCPKSSLSPVPTEPASHLPTIINDQSGLNTSVHPVDLSQDNLPLQRAHFIKFVF